MTPKNAIDDLFAKSSEWERNFGWKNLPANPLRRVAVVACMDSRQPLKRMLGLAPGDAHFIRNGGGLVTDDALRSLLISVHVKGVREIMVIQHTQCGMLGLDEAEFRARLEQQFGPSPDAPKHFGGFDSLDDSIRAQLERVRSYQWLPKDLVVRGFAYDVATGHMREVT